ncbi:LOW QUALITY PROTEIN: ornithine decarboxylase-like [Haliotis rubra]|uniref:LOW QUALITY PROTEIN: ornithine decarboxylase-like n=1 Tax=Haliotis rubra TaxID=36100 RepID=UPI001EE58B19|nr:LOW QUALITY PROTEIN: ornithine decarboxylase-like [Haliotis rubra]
MAKSADQKGRDDLLFLVDLGDVVNNYRRWRRLLPRVTPFYAVKCNAIPILLRVLSQLGAGFDCAKQGVVYANPCKQISHLEYAAKNNIDLMTFDNEAELYKIKSTFHVGSGVEDPEVFVESLRRTHLVFEIAAKMEFTLNTLDLGGGFYGHEGAPICFEKVAAVLNTSLDEVFPLSSNVKVIAEPGRYFATSPFTLVTSVIAKRKCTTPTEKTDPHELTTLDPERLGSEKPTYMYYMNDGTYGSFGIVHFEDTRFIPRLVKVNSLCTEPIQL